MPRITIYVPDELKSRMDDVDRINWSNVAQDAIRQAIATHSIFKEPENMDNVIERLRLSKERFNSTKTKDGKDCGASWARGTAQYEDLLRISDAVHEGLDIDIGTLQRLIDPQDEMDSNDWKAFWEENAGNDVSDAFVKGFAEGATAVFDKVADKL